METHLRAGIAVYNAGGYHVAHDAWEDYWLELESGTDDERFLHGLIQFTATIHHGQEGNWTGLLGLAESASEYLDGLPETYRGVELATVREYLDALAIDPEHVERVGPPPLRIDGEALEPDDLGFEATAVVAKVLAEEIDGYDEGIVERGIEYASEAVEADEDSRFVGLLFDFVTGEERALAYRRLEQHVERRRSRVTDIEGLFEEREEN